MPGAHDQVRKCNVSPICNEIVDCSHRIDVAVVDVNVSRVLSRLEGVPMKARALQDFADELVPQGLGWEWNQVMMDFGARHCTVRSPLCDLCPVRTQCKYKGVGDDPAQLSAGVSKPQPRFEGSDRQARGRTRYQAAGSRQTHPGGRGADDVLPDQWK